MNRRPFRPTSRCILHWGSCEASLAILVKGKFRMNFASVTSSVPSMPSFTLLCRTCLQISSWRESMQATEEVAAKPQAAMGIRSCSNQSFEDKFPGVFIRKKKKRDMDRCLSQTSMDSWVSENEQSEEMPPWFMNNPSPPNTVGLHPAFHASCSSR